MGLIRKRAKMDIEIIGREIKMIEFELSQIEEEHDRLIEQLESMREKITVFSCLKSRHRRITKDLVIVPSYQSVNNGLVLHHIHEITSIKELALCIALNRDSSQWEFSRKVLVAKFGEDNVCEAERRNKKGGYYR